MVISCWIEWVIIASTSGFVDTIFLRELALWEEDKRGKNTDIMMVEIGDRKEKKWKEKSCREWFCQKAIWDLSHLDSKRTILEEHKRLCNNYWLLFYQWFYRLFLYWYLTKLWWSTKRITLEFFIFPSEV